MDRLKLSPRSRGLVQTLVVITAVVSLASMLRYVEPTRVIDVLGRADLARLGLLVPLVLAASFGLRAARFRALLDPNDAQRISWLHVLVGVVLGQ